MRPYPSSDMRPKHPARSFSESYLEATAQCLRDISPEVLERLALRILDAYDRGAQIFIAGNGGSAALASHLACDLAKSVLGRKIDRKRRRMRVLSLCENMALLTAWANDESYECVFAEQLRGLAKKGDLLLCITASGNSPNILAALDTARELGMESMGWLGFTGGAAKGKVDDFLLVEAMDYGIVESVHATIAHLLTAWIASAMASRARERSVAAKAA